MYQLNKLKWITGHFKRSFLVLFTIMALFFIVGVARADEYIDFEDYDLGDLCPQENWICSHQTAYYKIQDEVIIQGGKTLRIHGGGFGGYYITASKKDFSKLEMNGKMTIKYIITNRTGYYSDRGFQIRINQYISTPLPRYDDVAWIQNNLGIVQALDDTNWVSVGVADDDILYKIIIEWNLDLQKYRVQIEGQNQSEWLTFPYYDFNYPISWINDVSLGSSWVVYYDELTLEGTECDSEHLFNCHTLTSCNDAGGFWDIVAQVCFDFEDLVSCGSGINLQYCDNETDCENNGGYWYNDFCYEAQMDILDFLDYYNAHSDFDTPTPFISSLAGFVSPFLKSAGNFLETFKNNFDITQATEKGYLLGSAVSSARGYLDIINDFFGGLPIAEMLILFIIVIILIVVIRIVIKIIHIIKP